jgi:hypothetical protein
MRRPEAWGSVTFQELGGTRERKWAASAGQLDASAEELLQSLEDAWARALLADLPGRCGPAGRRGFVVEGWFQASADDTRPSRPGGGEHEVDRTLRRRGSSAAAGAPELALRDIDPHEAPLASLLRHLITLRAGWWRFEVGAEAAWFATADLVAGWGEGLVLVPPSEEAEALSELVGEVRWAKDRLEYAMIDPDDESERYNSLAHVRRVIRERIWPICEGWFPERIPLLVVVINAITRAAIKHVTNDDLQELAQAVRLAGERDFEGRWVAQVRRRLAGFGVASG